MGDISLLKNIQVIKHQKPIGDVFTEESVKKFAKIMSKYGLDGVYDGTFRILKNPRTSCFAFDGGWVIISFQKFREEKALHVHAIYISKESPIDRKLFWKELDVIAKCFDCKYLIGESVISPKIWGRIFRPTDGHYDETGESNWIKGWPEEKLVSPSLKPNKEIKSYLIGKPIK